jgi:hypothetical protein
MACLIYADWLDEHDHAARAEYLRLLVALPKLWKQYRAEGVLDPHVENIARAQLRLRELRRDMADWVARVSTGKIVKCTNSLACPGQWKLLSETSNPRVRRCHTCGDLVSFCINRKEIDESQRGALDAFD